MPGYLGLPQSTIDYLTNRYVNPSIAGYQNEMKIFIAENLAMGISTAKSPDGTNMTKIIGDALKDVDYYGQKGSLYEAYDALEKVTLLPYMAPFLTASRKSYLKNRLISILSGL